MVRSLTSRISTSGGSGGSETKCEHNRVIAVVMKENWMAGRPDRCIGFTLSVISPVGD